MRPFTSQRRRSVVSRALRSCRIAFIFIGLFSGVINVLMLSGSFYMLQVYDRVLSSRSVETLIVLSLLLLLAYALQGFLDAIRGRMLARIGARFDEQVAPAAFTATQRLPLMGFGSQQSLQPIRDLEQIRGFLSSLGPTALFDMPWMPLFLAGCFLLHPWLGWLALAGGAVIVVLTGLTELSSRRASNRQAAAQAERQGLADACRRNAEAVSAMGMAPFFQSRWSDANRRHVRNWLGGHDATAGLGAFSKTFRMMLQSAVLGLGGYLAIRGEVSGGAMIAASIMTSRALAPIEIAVANWKGFVAAREGISRLKKVFALPGLETRERTALPPPERTVVVEGLTVAAPGKKSPILHGISLQLQAGQGLGVIGPSASGKSTLVRAMVGAWQPLKGDVRLDGAALDQWDSGELGRHIGYLPQDIELFDGTVAENIARFMPAAASADIVAAANAAGAHDLIVKLEEGYDTRIGEGGTELSGGQRQRIGLARALFGNPFLVVLDEPNSNLDREGDEALTEAVRGVRRRGGIVVIVTHRPTAIAGVDLIATLVGGRLQAFGPRENVLQSLMQHQRGGRPEAVA